MPTVYRMDEAMDFNRSPGASPVVESVGREEHPADLSLGQQGCRVPFIQTPEDPSSSHLDFGGLQADRM